MANLDLAGIITRTCSDLRAKFAALVHTHAASDITSGTLDAARLPVATTSAVGGVRVDGTTVTISNGVISAAGGGGGGSCAYLVSLTLNGTTVSDVSYGGSANASEIARALTNDPTTEVVFSVNASSDDGLLYCRPTTMQANYNATWGDVATKLVAVFPVWYWSEGDEEKYMLQLTYQNGNWYANKRITI